MLREMIPVVASRFRSFQFLFGQSEFSRLRDSCQVAVSKPVVCIGWFVRFCDQFTTGDGP